MTARFSSDSQGHLFSEVCNRFGAIGYSGDLLQSNYRYTDWFSASTPPKTIPAACFGRLPAAYDTALIGIALANGERGRQLANSHRALGSPIILEVGDSHVNIWSVGTTEEGTSLTESLSPESFANWITARGDQLRPQEFLRLKNLRTVAPQFFQLSLFAGLIPELEERIAESLEPKLTAAFRAGVRTYQSITGKPPSESALFKVAFWLLTGKVFSDRGHDFFSDLGENPDPDDVLARVAEYYREEPGHLLNERTRTAVFERIWTQMDFRNLSVDVLAQIWSRTLVTPETRKKLGIYRTRRCVVDYILERMPFEEIGYEDCHVLEPCSGTASFLIGAMDRMRYAFSFDSSRQRHSYFKKMLRGYERDPFGVEISRLCLALADYPNPNHWKIEEENVFTSTSFKTSLQKARIVLSNPPFRRFSESEKNEFGAVEWEPPAELLRLILEDLHPKGVIGLVLPRTFVNGKWFADVRADLVRRFGEVEIVKLPDKGWEHADPETALLIATEPRAGDTAAVTYGSVRDSAWQAFDWYHELSSRNTGLITAEAARKSFIVSDLRDVWEYLAYCRKVGDIAVAHHALRWSIGLEENFDEIVKDKPEVGYRLGIRPKAQYFCSFQCPRLAYLSFKQEHQKYKAFDLPWHEPKVIMNKTAKSRERWRVAAFVDLNGLACPETFFPLWLKSPELANTLAAVLNGPIANAFLTENSGKREFTLDSIHAIPFPFLSDKARVDIDILVKSYIAEVDSGNYVAADHLLRLVDAAVLAAYDLPPRLERRLLDYFKGSEQDGPRKVPFAFADYFPADFEPCFSLSDWLTGRHANATVEQFRQAPRDLPKHILEALQLAAEPCEDE